MIGKTKPSCGVVGEGVWVVTKPAPVGSGRGYVLAQSACDCWRTWHLMLSKEIDNIGGDGATWLYDRQRLGGVLSAVCGATIGYLDCALWSTSDEEGGTQAERDAGQCKPFDDWATVFDCSERLIMCALSDCEAFINEDRAAFDEYCKGIQYSSAESSAEEYFGHDLWLTREGHGAGFWDRGLGVLGDKLSERARLLGSFYLHSEAVRGGKCEVTCG